MHSSEADHDVQKQDSWLAMHLERGRRTGNALIEEVRCPVPECGESWKGKTAWDKRMDHVGVHWEKVAKGTEEGGWDESGGGLLEWAVEERVVTAAAGAIGWRLVCAKTFRRADDMEVHLKTHGELMLPAGNRQLAPTGLNDDDVPDVRKRKECPVCGTAFISASLKYHMDHKVCERDKSKEFRCDFCEKGFETPTSLIRVCIFPFYPARLTNSLLAQTEK